MVLWARLGGGIDRFHAQSVGQNPATGPWLTSRETGRCRLALGTGGEGSRLGGRLVISDPTMRSRSIWNQVSHFLD